jgi:hypothetical protein
MVIQKQIESMQRAEQIRAQLMANMFSADSGVMGVNGMMGPGPGPQGPRGEPGTPGIEREKYILRYAGLPFEIWLKPGTFAMIEDATEVNGDDLEFIKMMDKDEWEKIRETWCLEWHKRRGHRAFEAGLYEEFEAGVVL